LIGKHHYIIKNAEFQTPGQIIQRIVESRYLEDDFIPKDIYLAYEPDDMEYLTDWLAKKSERLIHIHIPKIGDKKKVIEMANANAEYILKEHILSLAKREQAIPRAVQSLQRDLRMDKPPRRIECFDNSHIQGSELVSSMVVFVDGKAKKSEYRKFKIKTVDKNDDFAAMRETVLRRYTRVKEELKESEYPDLVIVDGGKGQLSSAVEILKSLDLFGKIPIIGLAKRLEEVYFPGQSEPLSLPRTSSSLKLIQQLRDEAHRFAITFHRSLRDKRTLKTSLTDIEGVGDKTAQKLLIAFGSADNVYEASIDELTEHVNFKVASAIKKHK
jgi:excinuclease ABC subunit C